MCDIQQLVLGKVCSLCQRLNYCLVNTPLFIEEQVFASVSYNYVVKGEQEMHCRNIFKTSQQQTVHRQKGPAPEYPLLCGI